MKSASVQELRDALAAHGSDASYDFINVCTPSEYAEAHIPGVRSVPLDELGQRIGEFMGKNKVYIHCRSGGRSRMAMHALAGAGVEAELINVEGGMLAWADAGGQFDSTK